MALPVLAPVITRSKEIVSQRSNDVLLRLVPPLENGKATHKFFATFISALTIVSFLFLLFINTLLAQDAFELSSLKQEAKLIADEREAIDRAIAHQASPSTLARNAKALGMRPSESPVFLLLENASQTKKSEVRNG